MPFKESRPGESGPGDSDTVFPTLRDPVMIAAFEGWNDAGDAASGAVEHLELIWNAEPLAELDSEDYYDYQVNRPTVKQVDGVTREITWPSTTLSVCSPAGGTRDVVLLRGIEPNMRWRRFCDDLLELVEQLGVRTVVILGALLADTPHTRPVPVTGTAYSKAAAEQFRLEQTRYEGPTGIVGVLGGLGGFFCPIIFGYLLRATGLWTTCWLFFLILTVVCTVWLHLVVRSILKRQSPEQLHRIEMQPVARPAPGAIVTGNIDREE